MFLKDHHFGSHVVGAASWQGQPMLFVTPLLHASGKTRAHDYYRGLVSHEAKATVLLSDLGLEGPGTVDLVTVAGARQLMAALGGATARAVSCWLEDTVFPDLTTPEAQPVESEPQAAQAAPPSLSDVVPDFDKDPKVTGGPWSFDREGHEVVAYGLAGEPWFVAGGLAEAAFGAKSGERYKRLDWSPERGLICRVSRRTLRIGTTATRVVLVSVAGAACLLRQGDTPKGRAVAEWLDREVLPKLLPEGSPLWDRWRTLAPIEAAGSPHVERVRSVRGKKQRSSARHTKHLDELAFLRHLCEQQAKLIKQLTRLLEQRGLQ